MLQVVTAAATPKLMSLITAGLHVHGFANVISVAVPSKPCIFRVNHLLEQIKVECDQNDNIGLYGNGAMSKRRQH